MKKGLVSVAAVAALGLVLGTAAPVSADNDTVKIHLISKGETHQFWQAVKLGAETQAKKMNATVVFQGPASETMIDKQLEMLDAAIATKPDAIGYAALGTTQSVPNLRLQMMQAFLFTCSIQQQAAQASLALHQIVHLELLTQTAQQLVH